MTALSAPESPVRVACAEPVGLIRIEFGATWSVSSSQEGTSLDGMQSQARGRFEDLR